MERKSRTMIAVALSASFWLAGVALAAEKPPLKDAVKDPKAAAQKVIPKQVTKADSSAAATAAAAKAFEKVSAELYPKAKQEGNLVVYSVWDVEHLRMHHRSIHETVSRYQGDLLAGPKPGDRHPRVDRIPRRPSELGRRAFG